MAHRPADPLPVVEEVEDPKAKKGKESPEPGGAPEEPKEVLWRVPLRLELQRIVSATQCPGGAGSMSNLSGTRTLFFEWPGLEACLTSEQTLVS